MVTAGKSRAYRILGRRAEFLAARRGTRANGAYVRLEVRRREPDEAGTAPRVGFTVTKKCGNAPERNRIKRRLREAVRLAAADDMRAQHDYVIVAKRDVLTADFQALCEDLRAAIARAHTRAARPAGSGRTGPTRTIRTGH